MNEQVRLVAARMCACAGAVLISQNFAGVPVKAARLRSSAVPPTSAAECTALFNVALSYAGSSTTEVMSTGPVVRPTSCL
jgi:hypothetical protein